MTYREWIQERRREWTGKKVIYQGNEYNVVGVDYNGALLIDKKAEFTETTAVSVLHVRKING